MKTLVLSKHAIRRISWLKPAALCVAFLSLFAASSAFAAETIILGAADQFAVLGGSTVTNTGETIVSGNLGLSPGTSVVGFPPGVVVNGSIHVNDGLANQAHADAFTAYTQLAGETPTNNLTGTNLGGLTLTAGVYHFDSLAQLTGTLTLNTQGDPNAAFHFQIGSTLTTAANSTIAFMNGTSANVFWEVGSSATIGSGTTFVGTVIALTSITFNTGATLDGRALAINGAVTLDTNNINSPILATGHVWNGGASNLWSGVNWSPDLTGSLSSTLAPAADVVFSVTGVTPQNQNTVLDYDATISSLTVNDPAAVTISGTHTLSILGGGVTTGITINSGAGLTTIDSDVVLGATSSVVAVNNAAGLVIGGTVYAATGLTKSGAGALEVDGTIAGDTLVSAGSLRGDGTVSGSVINNALVSPGRAAATGTLSIGGDYTQSGAGTFSIQLGSPLNYDALMMGGSATLGGALNVTYMNGFNATPGDVFTIMTAVNGVTGQFSIFDDAHATGTLLTLQVVYQPNAVLLEFTQGSFVGAIPPGSDYRNERAVARGLDKLAVQQPGNELILELDMLPIAQVPGALSLLSPEDLAAIFPAGLAISQVQIGNLERRLDEVRQGVTGFSDSGYAVTKSYAASDSNGKNVIGMGDKQIVAPLAESEKRWGAFIAGTGEIGDVESTNSARGSSFTTGGVTVGADYRVSNHFAIGAALGYANTFSDLSRGGSLSIDSGKASIYATLYNQGFYVNGIVGGGYESFDTKRRTIGGFARGETSGADFNTLAGTGYDFHFGAFTFGPVASLQYSTIGVDGFTESGALGALRIDSQCQDSLKSAVGLKASYAARIGRVVLTPQVRAQWQHEYLTSTSTIDAGFTADNSFTVHGPHIGPDALLLDAGATAQLTSNLAVFAYYTGELGRQNYTLHGVNGGVRVSF